MYFAYVNSVTEYDSTEQQLQIIEAYCADRGINFKKFKDTKAHKRRAVENERAKALGLSAERYLYTYPSLEEMFCEIKALCKSNEKEIFVLVDTKIRLQGCNYEQKKIFDEIIKQCRVHVIEAGAVENVGNDKKGVCIYHYTNKSEHRNINALKSIDMLYSYAEQMELSVTGIFVDSGIYQRKYIDELISMLSQKVYEGVIVHSAYHISRKIGRFIKCVKAAGIVYSYTEGKFCIKDIDNYKDNALNAIVIVDNGEITMIKERALYYISNYTNWNLIGTCCVSDKILPDDKDNIYADIAIVDTYSVIEDDVYRYLKKISVIGTICSLRERSVFEYERKGCLLCQSIDHS